MHSFLMPSSMRNDRISVALIGLGGNGGQMLTGLAKLHQAMIALGHPAGLHVTAFDNDLVSESNVGRQLYYATDVGQNKADVLVQRVNRCYGLDFESRPERLTERSLVYNYDLIIGHFGSILVIAIAAGKWYLVNIGANKPRCAFRQWLIYSLNCSIRACQKMMPQAAPSLTPCTSRSYSLIRASAHSP